TFDVRVHGRGGVEGRDDGRAGAGRPRRECGGGGHRVPRAGPRMGAGRRRSRRQREVHRRDRRGARERSEVVDFSRVALSDEDEAFLHESRDFLRDLVTDEVLRRDRETGDNFDEGVHLALGEAGYLTREWKPESEGGFGRVRNRIWQLEKRRAHVPWVTFGTTAMIARSVEKFGSPELKAEVMPRVFDGRVRLCLGYTEPEGGSDVAT